jgi:hypothetical protein
MENIIVPDSTFNYNTVVLHTPIVVSGGNHFLKINRNDEPVYIQSPKCNTKQGILKAGKKMYCDLVFTNENEAFIRWIEHLEEHIQKTIYQNKTKWFESSLELNDIEDSFTSPFKIYKSGKFYLLRVNIPCRLGTCGLKIFKESGNETVDIENITPDTKIITILEVQGVKCSAKSFQIEIEIKQMMVLEDKNLFERCIIKPSAPSTQFAEPVPISVFNSTTSEQLEEFITKSNNTTDERPKESFTTSKNSALVVNSENTDTSLIDTLSGTNNDIQIEKQPKKIEEQPKKIEEFDIDIDILDKNEPIQIKERNDVYYEMYKTAISKAKNAKILAISSFLEAKRIKNKYMIEDEDTDDDDDDDGDYDVDTDDDDYNKDNK